MNENTQDVERRQRLKDWFQSSPDIWKDIVQELNISLHNENVKLAARDCTNRDWSAGWVCSHEFIIDMERYFKKVWNLPLEIMKKK